ncbi:biotin/lipoyl-binding protein [Phototrophicus methaneseepsis]|uniref:Biotin/lipoyl-binding protein n=1 Tax=Phototrophicus methaneseepsis TaxID=2710758 RepID=A0A7S8E7L4_9CHLR|nr:acetyl-CoA carboxylase biotin carboxyl carrier protein subunit [Phototrophicus methaneseepsis]QPC81846.1 biotin/lipoyl-binding protein [Phototrophicus methaneseepsis]
MKYTTLINGKQFEMEIERDGSLLINGERVDVDFLNMGSSLYSLIIDNRSIELAIDEDNGQYQLLVDGRLYEAQVLDERALFLANRRGGLGNASGEIKAPMPGLIVEVLVSVGDTVTEGQTVIILESMKMQNELKAAQDGIIKEIFVKAGQTVDKNAPLTTIGGDED